MASSFPKKGGCRCKAGCIVNPLENCPTFLDFLLGFNFEYSSACVGAKLHLSEQAAQRVRAKRWNKTIIAGASGDNSLSEGTTVRRYRRLSQSFQFGLVWIDENKHPDL